MPSPRKTPDVQEAPWMEATRVLASTLRDYIALQKKHQEELRAFASNACQVLEVAAEGSYNRVIMEHVSSLFSHAASAPEELCVSLPLDIDELQAELQHHVVLMDDLKHDTEVRRQAYETTKHSYKSALESFHDSFAQASKHLSTALSKNIDAKVFSIVDTNSSNASNESIHCGKDSKLVNQVIDGIRCARQKKSLCEKQYKELRKAAGEYAQSLDSMTATQQTLERECSSSITSIVQKFIVCYLSLVKNMEYDLVQLHGSVEEEQAKNQTPPLFVGHAATIHHQMQAHPPPLAQSLDLAYFLEQHFPSTHVRPLLVRHHPRAHHQMLSA